MRYSSRNQWMLILLALTSVVLSLPAWCVTLADNFAQYAEGSGAAAQWRIKAEGFSLWEVHNGTFMNNGTGHDFAIPTSAPYAKQMVVQTTITVQRATADNWKTAGLAVCSDLGNYWHLAFVEAPNSGAKRHYVEFAEKLNGQWLAQGSGDSKLRVTANQGGNFNWQYNHPYRLRIELTPADITGIITELDGTVCSRMGYAFDQRAVTTGQPALTTTCLAAAYDDFSAEITATIPSPAQPTFSPFPTAAPAAIRGKRTGYFHVEQQNGRWWIIDPNGNAFYAVGTDHVNYNAHWCEALGYAPYHRNLEKKFGSEEKWAESAVERLRAWGFNTLGAGCIQSVRSRNMVHTYSNLTMGTSFSPYSYITPKTTWTGFPDVFDPKFDVWCNQRAQNTCAQQKNDPWLLGYFLDNELEWYGKDHAEYGLIHEVFKLAADRPAKKALIEFLRQKYPTIAAFNTAWGAKAASFDALLASTEPVTTTTEAGNADQLAFMRMIAERYFAISTAAIRKADPNHMILGCRFAGRAPEIWDIAGKYLDIVSVNYYGQVDQQRKISTDMPQKVTEYYHKCKRPMMMTEWSFPALDAGLPCNHGAGQRVATQKDKAECYAIYQKTLFGMPFMVGSDYFMWVDQPAQGISSTFPEDSNYGLVDEHDNAWPELTTTAAKLNPLAIPMHAGNIAELSCDLLEKPAKSGSVILRIRNAGKAAATCPIHWWVQGVANHRNITVKPGSVIDIPLQLTATSLVTASVDPDDIIAEGNEGNNLLQRIVTVGSTTEHALLVVNRSGNTLSNVPVAVPLGKLGSNWMLTANGKPLSAQLDELPTGPELAVLVPEVPARSVVALTLKPGKTAASTVTKTGDRQVDLTGGLHLEHDNGSGYLFDRVSVGTLPLGAYTILIQEQTAKGMAWIQPTAISAITSYAGPVRTVLLMTGDNVKYLGPQQWAGNTQIAGKFRAAFRLTYYPTEQWFASRFLRVENVDTAPWWCESYFHRPESKIAGEVRDDEARSVNNAQYWYDAKAAACYAGIYNLGTMKGNFWKDTDGIGEHPDIYRSLRHQLAPGQAIDAAADDTDVLMLGSRTVDGRPDPAILQRAVSIHGITAYIQ